jgi:hypothetical protein
MIADVDLTPKSMPNTKLDLVFGCLSAFGGEPTTRLDI